jgi:hypothetical protein
MEVKSYKVDNERTMRAREEKSNKCSNYAKPKSIVEMRK